MLRGAIRLILGGVMIVGGATGQLTFRGTNSTGPLIGLGVLLCALGVWNIVGSRQKSQ